MPEPIQPGAQKPRLIYLQWVGDSDEPPTGNEEIRDADVTWSRERVFEHDLVYSLIETPIAPADHHDQTQNALLPCPFCGNEPNEGIYTDWPKRNFVACDSDCPVEPEVTGHSISAARKLWNTRAAPSVPSGNAANTAPIPPKSSLPSKGALRMATIMRGQGCISDKDILEWATWIDSETGLPELLQALKPFAEVAAELATIGFVFREDQWLWKPSSNTRDTKGINAQHIIDAANVLSKAERGADK